MNDEDPYNGGSPFPMPMDAEYSQADLDAAVYQERERCARVCERIACEQLQPDATYDMNTLVRACVEAARRIREGAEARP